MYYSFLILKLRFNVFLPVIVLFFLGFFTLVSAQPNSMNKMQSKDFNFDSFSLENTSETPDPVWNEVNSDAMKMHPEFGKLPHNAPCENCVEVLSKRTSSNRYFVSIDDTNTFYSQAGFGNIHHFENGYWKTIDHRLKSISSDNFQSNYFANPITISTNNEQVLLNHDGKLLSFNNWKLYKKFNNITTLLDDPDWSVFTAGDDGVFVENIFPGIDAELIVMRGAVKTNFIIRNVNNYGDFDELIFEDQILFDNSEDVSLHFSSNPHDEEGVGSVVIHDITNNEIAQYGSGVAYPKNGDKSNLVDLLYRIDKNTLQIVVENSWIKNLIDDYPLVIDPVVTGTNTLAQAAITGSQYNASCNFDNSCDHNLTVPAPANATFDDVTWSFTYIAQGACWLEDGATRFTTGTCVSPDQAGFYWFCNQIGGGTCEGNNISIFNDLGGCLPQPSCNPQNVDFTLQFFRRCWGTAGCNNTCIGADSPWTVTIQGQTIEYSNAANPITVSSSNICQGESISASTQGQFGVPGYTYEWSFDPSGTPVIATGANANIVFPVDGTITLYSIVTDACGNEVVESTNITVTAAPQLTVTATDEEICEGQSATLTASGGGATYTWDNGLGTGASQTVSPTTTTTYTVNSTVGSGCQGVGTIEIVVNPIPDVSAGPDQDVCENENVLLEGTGTANSYSWDNGVTDGVAFTPPVGSTTYTVTGESLGCTDTDQMVVNVQPDILFDVTGTDPVTCGGSDGFIEFSNLPPNTSLTITYLENGVTQTITQTSNGSGEIVINNLGTASYDGFEVELNGCTSTNSDVITLNSPNNPNISAPADLSVCEGNQITLTATNPNNSSISWDGGVTDGVAFTPTVGTTVYTVTATLNGCVETDDVEVTVNPEVNFSVQTTDPSACGVSDGTITIIGLEPNENYDISFEQNGALVGPITITTNGSGSYEVGNLGNTSITNIFVESLFGCDASDSDTYTISSPGTPSVIAPNDFEVCEGDFIILSAQNPDGATITWDNGVVDGQEFIQNPGTITYTVTAELSGCSSTDEVVVTVNPNPVVDAGDDLEICTGQSVVLSGAGALTYQWDNGVVNGVSFEPTQTNNYTVVGTDANGCEGTDQVLIDVNELDAPTFNADVFEGCQTLEVNFTNTTTYNYQDCTWDFGDGSQSSGCGTVTHTFTQPGFYSVTLTVSDGPNCNSSTTIQNMITVTSPPIAAFTASNQVLNDDDMTVNFINSSQNATDYFWDFGDEFGNSTEENPSYTFEIPSDINADYTVVLFAENGPECYDSATMIIRYEEQIIFYVPNAFTPDEDKHNPIFKPIITAGIDPYDYNLTIFNRWGETVFESNNPEVGWDGTYGDQGLVQEGVYIWKISFKELSTDKRHEHHGHVTILK